MPKGIIVIKWDDEFGAKLLAKYPENLKIPSKTLLNIYTNHRLNNTEPGFGSLNLPNMRILSFFSGMGKDFIVASNYIIAFLLLRNEKAINFKDLLKRVSAEVLSKIDDSRFEKLLEQTFKEMGKIP